jgi:hypothetical protein
MAIGSYVATPVGVREENQMTNLPFITVLLGLFAIVSSGCDQPAPVKPLISKLKEPGARTVSISLGSEAGVNVGDVFDVYRDNKPFGKLKITAVEPDQSTATISETRGAQKLETGDIVIREVTLQFLRKLESNSHLATPAETGRAFAEADIGSGINRILYYGKPWSEGKPLIDDQTGYPVTVISGCIVTKAFTLLVEEYNLAMREHFRKKK